MILKQGHTYEPMPHDGKVIRRIYRGGRCYYIASPYSPEATQALKAAFPQYWTAIRDYGVAHPQLVPFINEDPMLIVSLVEVGKTRILDTNGAINTPLGVNTSSDTILKVTLEFTAYTGNVHIGYHPGNDSQDWRLFDTGGTMYFDCGSARISQSWALNKKVVIEAGNTYITANGVTKTASAGGTIATGEMVICKEDGAFKSYGNMEIYDGEQWNIFAPMIDQDGVGCLLNTTKGTKHYPTSGTFTIQITDKA